MAVMKNINGSLSHMQTELSTLAREEETTDDNLCSLEESLLAHEETIVFLRQEAIAAKQLTNRPQIEVREERHRHRAQEQTEDWPKQRSKSQTFEESDHGSCALNPAASDVDRSHEANSIDEVQQDNEEIEEHSPKRNRKRERQRLRRQRKRALNRESKVELSSDPVEEDAISIGANLVQAYHESPKPETTKALMDHLYASIDQIHVRDPHINSSNLMARLAHYYDHVRQAADSTLPWKDLESYSQNIWYLLKALEGSSFDLTQDTFRRDFEYLRWVWSLVAHIESLDHGYVYRASRLHHRRSRLHKEDVLNSLRLSVSNFSSNARLDSYRQALKKATFKDDWIAGLRNLRQSIETLFLVS